MTSEIQKASNRYNSTRSTGPRTTAGKERSRTNALRHGFAAAVRTGSERASDAVVRLARAIAGESTDPQVLACAEAIAYETVEIARAKAAKLMLIDPYEEPPPGNPVPTLIDILNEIAKVNGYMGRALSRRRRAVREWHRLTGAIVSATRDDTASTARAAEAGGPKR